MEKLSKKWLLLLHKLVNLLDHPSDLSRTLDACLKLLADDLGMLRGAITLVDPKSGQIRIEACHGLNRAQMRRGEYAPGEGVTGRVIETGEPMCVADVSREPLFLNRTKARNLNREQISFLCVPIKLGGETVGALSADQLLSPLAFLEDELRLLQIIAALLAQSAYDIQMKMEMAEQTGRPRGFIGNSEAMRQVYAQIDIVARALTTVFLQGESGTGKELAAKAIHAASPRAGGAFISLNCAALPENLIESELFGHERGAFTGATQMRKGRFELANGGTLFLDEVGELSPLIQAKLLRVLQERSFERLGGMRTIHSDARLITATNRNLEQMVDAGSFRRDLFYRLNVFPVYLPPLRDRRDDIPALAAHFLELFASANHKKTPRLSLAALDMMQRYEWPGNIRELQNVMERAALLTGHENMVLPRHLPGNVRGELNGGKDSSGHACALEHFAGANLNQQLEEMEKACIIDALSACGGHLNKAAANLGLTERILGLRLKKYALDYKEFRKR